MRPAILLAAPGEIPMAGHSAELHICGQGTHMFNMGRHGTPSDHWIDRYLDWVDTRKPPR